MHCVHPGYSAYTRPRIPPRAWQVHKLMTGDGQAGQLMRDAHDLKLPEDMDKIERVRFKY